MHRQPTNEYKMGELSVQVSHLREAVKELKDLPEAIAVLKQQQKQDQEKFGDRQQVEQTLKADLEKSQQQCKQEIDTLGQKLRLLLAIADAITNTPGGFKTWTIAGTISLLLSLTAIDISVRAIGVDILLRHWLINQTSIEKIMSD